MTRTKGQAMNVRGIGDRWMAGEAIAGVDFAFNDRVEVLGGPQSGRAGTIALLLGLRPEPTYLVTLTSPSGDTRVRQSEVRRAAPLPAPPAEAGMPRRIAGFHTDDAGDWIADLECGHGQHVRHEPPLVSRPWVLTAGGRAEHVGTELRCVACGQRAPEAS